MNYNWSFQYQIGIETIDNEHRLFLSLIKKFELSKSRKTDLQAFDEIVRYMRYHFESEENLMRINKYSKYNEHKISHLKLLDKVIEFQTDIELDSFDKEAFQDFLLNWFAGHTTGLDKQFSEELKNLTPQSEENLK